MKKLLLMTIALLSININAQNPVTLVDNDVPIRFNIYLDGTKQESDSILIGVGNSKSFIKVTDYFTTFVVINREYNFTITAPRYNKKRVKVIPTKKDKLITCDIYLASNKPDEDIGILKYNKYLNKYLVYN